MRFLLEHADDEDYDEDYDVFVILDVLRYLFSSLEEWIS